MRTGFILILILLGLNACKNNNFTPKPHGYPRVYYPIKAYQIFDSNAPFSFLYPTYAEVKNYDESDVQNYWYNINYLPFNATLHISYKSFKNRNQFDSLFDDTRKLAYKHTIKADEIEETEVHNSSTGTSGIIYDLKGNTATNLNFYVSDGKKHFLRGALYFNAKTTNDSILPVFNFLREDVVKMIESTKWK
ncbi:MAG: gliding motility lipoprotein GldD [bacterium]|nr:gliding motility lipoprotein GldD [bacterium]